MTDISYFEYVMKDGNILRIVVEGQVDFPFRTACVPCGRVLTADISVGKERFNKMALEVAAVPD